MGNLQMYLAVVLDGPGLQMRFADKTCTLQCWGGSHRDVHCNGPVTATP